MELDDRVTVSTPEGVDVDLVVAGLGSRFSSSIVDTTVQGALIFTSLVVGGAVAGGVAVASVGSLLAIFGYPIVCDALLGGRTLGRRLTGLKLVTDDGGAVDLTAASLRNIIRVIDFLPAFYSVGAIACLATTHTQRLGDMAAGTIVVRLAPSRAAQVAVPGARRADPAPIAAVPPEAATWDLTGLGRDDLAVVRSFLERRGDLDPEARARVARELARRLAPVVVGPDPTWGDEAFLEAVAAAKDERSR